MAGVDAEAAEATPGTKETPASPSAKQPRDEDKWVDGLFRYWWRERLFMFSDPRGRLVRGVGSGLWSAAEVLSDYFVEHAEIYRDATCLELGSGLGAVGMTLGKFGARLVVLTDMPFQIPLTQRNVEGNFSNGEEVHVRPLDWRCEEHRTGLAPWNRSWSLIVGSDVGYDPELLGPLLETLLAQCGPDTSVYFALADREEDDEPDVNDFIQAAQDHFDIKEVHARRLEPQQSVTRVLLMKLKEAQTAP